MVKLYSNMFGVSQTDARKILDTIPEFLLGIVAAGEQMTLPGVLTVGVRLSPPKRAFDFASGKVVIRESKPVPYAKIGTHLKEAAVHAPIVSK